MTPKEKAKELVQLFYNNQCSHSVTELAYKSAKKCALICVDEILEFHDRIDVKYWKEIKQEINKL